MARPALSLHARPYVLSQRLAPRRARLRPGKGRSRRTLREGDRGRVRYVRGNPRPVVGRAEDRRHRGRSARVRRPRSQARLAAEHRRAAPRRSREPEGTSTAMARTEAPVRRAHAERPPANELLTPERLLAEAAARIVVGWCQKPGGGCATSSGRALERERLPLVAPRGAAFVWFETAAERLDAFATAYTALALATGGRLEEWNAAPWRTKARARAFARAQSFGRSARAACTAPATRQLRGLTSSSRAQARLRGASEPRAAASPGLRLGASQRNRRTATSEPADAPRCDDGEIPGVEPAARSCTG